MDNATAKEDALQSKILPTG